MTLLTHGRTVAARAPRAHVPSSKESELSVNTSFSSNSILPRGPSLPTALETFHSRLIWTAGAMVKSRFGQQCLWPGQTPHPYVWVQSSVPEAPDVRGATAFPCTQRGHLPSGKSAFVSRVCL